MIQHGLVEGDLAKKPKFLEQNQQLLREIEQLAARQRRTDWIVAQQTLYEFYDQHLPATITDLASLTQWLRKSPAEAAHVYMRREDLLGEADAPEVKSAIPRRVRRAEDPLSACSIGSNRARGATASR